ncbi:MAG: DUF4968 domain-containing protein, partial [Bacteroidales bacterium]|nr:DUF4968 domain-containing protein [Bacteroidales bacterium]
MRFYHPLIALTFLLAACGGGESGSGYVKNEKGVEVNVKATGEKVRLQVFGDRIIRVSATKDNAFKDPQSLAVVAQKCQPEFRVEQSGDTVKVITNALRANVLTSSGKVFFTDLSGNILLSEADGGRTFEPYQVTQTHADGKPETYKGWSYRQVFDSPDDEAIYGLGQHQADDWNYKGKNEELFQYNTKVSVPFVVSSRNYGLMFDSYSLMRFGNPNPYSFLKDVFTLYNKDGKQGALTGTYNIKGQDPIVRDEDSLYYEDFKTVGRLLPKGLGDATVVIEGQIEPKESGEYRFLHYYSGYQTIT